MKRIELEIEHNYKDRFLGLHVVKDQSLMTVLGNSKEASIRLMGGEVEPIHAIIEFDGGEWMISDLSTETGTWHDQERIVEHKLDKPTRIVIGEHQLKLTPKVITSSLFEDLSSTQSSDDHNQKYHQVVIKKNKLVIDTHLLAENESYFFKHDGKTIEIKPPTANQWVTESFGDMEVLKRLALTRKIELKSADGLIDPNLKKPAMGAAVLMALLAIVFIIANSRDKMEIKDAPKNNTFTKIIFDAKVAKKKKSEAMQSQRKLQASGVTNPAEGAKNIKTTIPKTEKSTAVVNVVNNLKASGLSQLIGKIAKRAAKTSALIEGAGVAAGSGASGRALAAVGSTGTVGSPNGVAGATFKVQGVGTNGVGGGGKGFAGAAGLATGGVGSANVGILEDETEVDGGLEREVISRTIEKYLGEIRYCYERQLSANPDLYGKIMVSFTIGGEGQVIAQGIGSSTMNNTMVEGCMLRKVAKWQFPKPKGGTLVSVSYPFLFKSSQ